MRVVVGLGSNLGDREATLREAVARLDRAPGVRVLACSSVYETDPIGPPQPDYLNAAVLVETDLDLEGLLLRARAIETALGRDRAREVRWGPRTLDLDLLWSPDATVAGEALTVPHPRLSERAFALAPLLEVAPEAPYAGALAAVGGPPPVVGSLGPRFRRPDSRFD